MAAEPRVAEADDADYSPLKELLVGLEGVEGRFSLCFWIYLSNTVSAPATITAPATILRQFHPDIKDEIPFLALSKEKKIVLCPLLFLHPEAHSSGSFSWTYTPCASAEVEFSLNKWVHVGCEVAATFVCLYIDGVMVQETPLSQSSKNDSYQEDIKKLTLAGNDGTDGKVQGYVHYLQLLPQSTSIAGHFVKNPPLKLSLDASCISEKQEIEEGDDGVWSVVGGKASCRRYFSLDVVLSDALGRSVHKEIELIASLVYYDNGASVEKSEYEAEAPLLTSCDGVELPSNDRPIKLLHGRASFKLKISQLSSKCDNRLFQVHFGPLNSSNNKKYPFLEAFSCPIRCISRNRNTRTSSLLWKKRTSTIHQIDGPQPAAADKGSPEVQSHRKDGHFQSLNQRMSKYSTPLKRVKVGSEKSSIRIYASTVPEHLESVYGSHCLIAKEDGNAFQMSMEGKPGNLERTGSIPSDSESVHIRSTDFRKMEDTKKLISDMRQILAAKALVLEGIDTWNSITWNSMAQSNVQVPWEIAVQKIDKKFMKISHCSSRGLSMQDMELLQRVAGCQEMITRENFDKMWCCLYPVAISVSREHINAIWECTSPKWIEGLITKEDAEASLTAIGLQRPGTFILRFPTSRSWPHPDSGNLIVTYVGADYSLHHKMLSLDDRGANAKPLQDLLMAEPELSQLGRVTRQARQSVGAEA